MKRWSDDEIRLIRSNTPTKDLEKIMDRSVSAINHKRLKLGISFSDGVFAPSYYTEQEKVARIYTLAEKYGIRLLEGAKA